MGNGRLFRAFFLAVAFCLGGCFVSGRNCTLIGCNDIIQISWSKPLPGFKVHAMHAADTLRAECDNPRTRCQDTAFVLNSHFGGKKPGSISLRITDADGRIAFEGPVALSWEGDLYPNGRECDRFPCQAAKARIDL